MVGPRLAAFAAPLWVALCVAWAGLAPTPATAQPSPPGRGIQRIELPQPGALPRTYAVVQPEKAPIGKIPMILLLHGAVGNAEAALVSYGLRDLALSGKAIVVAPNGTRADPLDPATDWRHDPLLWNDGSGRGAVATRLKVDDVTFLAGVVADAQRRFPVDPERLYVVGFGGGGSMALRFAAERSDLIAGVASVGGSMWVKPPKLVRAFSVLVMIGDKDPVNPWIGGPVDLPWDSTTIIVPPMVETLERWAGALTCVAGPKKIGPQNGVVERRLGPCVGNAYVSGLVIENHGHRWPGAAGDLLPAAMVGPATLKLDATRTIWAFLEPLRRQQPIRYPG